MKNCTRLINKELMKRLERIEGDVSVVMELLQAMKGADLNDDSYQKIYNIEESMQDACKYALNIKIEINVLDQFFGNVSEELSNLTIKK